MTFPEVLLTVYACSLILRLVIWREHPALLVLCGAIVGFVWVHAPFVAVLVLAIALAGELGAWLTHALEAWRARRSAS